MQGQDIPEKVKKIVKSQAVKYYGYYRRHIMTRLDLDDFKQQIYYIFIRYNYLNCENERHLKRAARNACIGLFYKNKWGSRSKIDYCEEPIEKGVEEFDRRLQDIPFDNKFYDRLTLSCLLEKAKLTKNRREIINMFLNAIPQKEITQKRGFSGSGSINNTIKRSIKAMKEVVRK